MSSNGSSGSIVWIGQREFFGQADASASALGPDNFLAKGAASLLPILPLELVSLTQPHFLLDVLC